MMPTPVMDVVIVPLYVVAQGHPGRHPDVEPTDTSATGAGHEDQRATVERQVWLKLGKLGVHWPPQVHRWRPGVVHTRARGRPKIELAHSTGSAGAEEYLSAVASH